MEELFGEFESLFNKNYINEDEKLFRMKIFEDATKEIKIFNKENNPFKMGINSFSDLKDTEFNDIYSSDLTDLIKKNENRMD